MMNDFPWSCLVVTVNMSVLGGQGWVEEQLRDASVRLLAYAQGPTPPDTDKYLPKRDTDHSFILTVHNRLLEPEQT